MGRVASRELYQPLLLVDEDVILRIEAGMVGYPFYSVDDAELSPILHKRRTRRTTYTTLVKFGV